MKRKIEPNLKSDGRYSQKQLYWLMLMMKTFLELLLWYQSHWVEKTGESVEQEWECMCTRGGRWRWCRFSFSGHIRFWVLTCECVWMTIGRTFRTFCCWFWGNFASISFVITLTFNSPVERQRDQYKLNQRKVHPTNETKGCNEMKPSQSVVIRLWTIIEIIISLQPLNEF
jgi:hypothetical protein